MNKFANYARLCKDKNVGRILITELVFYYLFFNEDPARGSQNK